MSGLSLAAAGVLGAAASAFFLHVRRMIFSPPNSERNSLRERMLHRYELLAKQARDCIFFLRREDCRIIEANQAALDTYGYSIDELLAMTGYDLRTPEAAARADDEIPAAGAFNVFLETEHRRKDGSVFPVEVSIQSAVIDGEQIVVSMVRDVSERHESERAVREALAKATNASRMKSEFLAAMSHEIRTPMNGVIGMTELLLETPLTAEQREYATTASESAHALLGVINGVLDFSKIEAGKVELEVVEIDLVRKVETVGNLLSPTARAKGVALMTYVDPAIPQRILGDPVRLRQVLVNLAGNGIKFTESGSVVLSADLVSRNVDRARVRFAVRDTGIGIDPSVLPALFEAFRQADGATTRRYGGTGLGLAISKRLVEAMGGTIEVVSRPGSGSTFSFTLEFPVIVQSSQRSVRGELRGRRALIVDDDVAARDILARYVTSWGLTAATAETAEEALHLLRSAAEHDETFDLAIIDMRLPDADGIELGRTLRTGPANRTKLILVTAFDVAAAGRDAIAAGFSAYLTKPVRQSQLYDGIVNALLGTGLEAAPSPLAPRHDSRTERILVVEDNAVNRQVALRQLESLGYRAEYATDGHAAVERAAREPFDLILMDCQMPVMDGFTAAREIRRREISTGLRVPIVAMTANALSADREECLGAGMDDFIAKPVSLKGLGSVLERWIGMSKVCVLDRHRLADIFGGDGAAQAEFFGLALPTIQGLCERIASAPHRDLQLELAHELKGSASNIGANELAQAAETFETELKNSVEPQAIRWSIGRITRACQRLAAAIAQTEMVV
jgi:two-component system sensor histidine kinase/response regulator